MATKAPRDYATPPKDKHRLPDSMMMSAKSTK